MTGESPAPKARRTQCRQMLKLLPRKCMPPGFGRSTHRVSRRAAVSSRGADGVPHANLSESAKDLDRATVRSVVAGDSNHTAVGDAPADRSPWLRTAPALSQHAVVNGAQPAWSSATCISTGTLASINTRYAVDPALHLFARSVAAQDKDRPPYARRCRRLRQLDGDDAGFQLRLSRPTSKRPCHGVKLVARGLDTIAHGGFRMNTPAHKDGHVGHHMDNFNEGVQRRREPAGSLCRLDCRCREVERGDDRPHAGQVRAVAPADATRPGVTSTEVCARLNTPSVVEPNTRRSAPEMPWLPTTMRSAPTCCAV